jgi:hypothetical protein
MLRILFGFAANHGTRVRAGKNFESDSQVAQFCTVFCNQKKNPLHFGPLAQPWTKVPSSLKSTWKEKDSEAVILV